MQSIKKVLAVGFLAAVVAGGMVGVSHPATEAASIVAPHQSRAAIAPGFIRTEYYWYGTIRICYVYHRDSDYSVFYDSCYGYVG